MKIRPGARRLISLEGFVIQSWWTVAFVLACYACYESGAHILKQQRRQLQSMQRELLQERQDKLALQEDYKRQIASQDDPAWIELSLIRVLGLVPKGATKVCFEEED